MRQLFAFVAKASTIKRRNTPFYGERLTGALGSPHKITCFDNKGFVTMSLTRSVTLAIAAVVAATTSAHADRMPAGSRVASQEAVTSTYAGKTDLWVDDCNGGIFYAANGQARAWCADDSNSLGAGRWFVDAQGQLCTDLTWYWTDGNNSGAGPVQRNCISHVQDPLGGLWRSWPTSSEWWHMRRSNTSLVRGYRFQDDVLRTRQKIGL